MEKPILRIECDCGHPGHFFALYPWDGTAMLSVVCETDRGLPLLSRIKHAFFYVLGQRHLNYSEVVLDREWTLEKIYQHLKTKEAPQKAEPPVQN